MQMRFLLTSHFSPPAGREALSFAVIMASNDTSVIQTVGLTKTFKDFWHRPRVVAVDHLDLDIHANEVFGLLGPNGSGKTTTIKMLLGLLYPTRGRIRVLGKPPTDVSVK